MEEKMGLIPAGTRKRNAMQYAILLQRECPYIGRMIEVSMR